MTRRVRRLCDLTHTQIGILLSMHNSVPLRKTPRGWFAPKSGARINRQTFDAMVSLGLVSAQASATKGMLTPAGFALADIAVTLSREIAAGIAGLPPRLLIEAKADPADVPEGEPAEVDGSTWDHLRNGPLKELTP